MAVNTDNIVENRPLIVGLATALEKVLVLPKQIPVEHVPLFFRIPGSQVSIHSWGVFLGEIDLLESSAAIGRNGVEKIRFVRIAGERLANLELKLAQNLVDRQRLNELEKENEVLRATIGAGLDLEYRYEPSEIVGIGGGEVRLVGGENKGFEEGMSVVAEGVLVARLKNVSEAVSEAWLLTNEESRVAARLTTGRNTGLVVGEEGKLYLDDVQQRDEVKVDDLVVSTGLDGVIPNLVIGEVEDVGEVESSVTRRVLIRQPKVVGLADYVFVVMVKEAND